MPKRVPPLTDLQIRRAKIQERPYRLADGYGLYIEIMPTGSKIWRLKYRRPDRRENRLTFGAYPGVSLVEAREKALAARSEIRAGRDPADRPRREARERDTCLTFEAVAREWHSIFNARWQPDTAADILHRLETDIFPEFGALPIGEVTGRDVLEAIRKIEERGALEVARRNLANCSRIFDYAASCTYVNGNPAAPVRRALRPKTTSHFAAITAEQLPDFLVALESNEARMKKTTRIAVRLMMLIFVRTSELIETPWSEIPLDTLDWVIPAHRMKMGRRRVNPSEMDHAVCPSRQVKELLMELHRLTGHCVYLFPNEKDDSRFMSENTILKVLERMGYKHEMTGHGFRTLAMSTLKEQLNYRHETVDRQLAHKFDDKLMDTYDRAEYMRERRKMMQDWADYLDAISAQARLPRSQDILTPFSQLSLGLKTGGTHE